MLLLNPKPVQPHSSSVEQPRPGPVERRASHSLRLDRFERKALLAAGDLAILCFAWASDLVARYGLSGAYPNFLAHWWWLTAFGVMWLVSTTCLGAYDLRAAASAQRSQWLAAGAVLMTSAMYTITPFVTPFLPDRRLVLLVIPIIGSVGLALWRQFYARVIAQPHFQRRCLVVGAGAGARRLVDVLTENSSAGTGAGTSAGYRILGFIDGSCANVCEGIGNTPVLGTTDDLVRLALDHRVDELILSITPSAAIQAGLVQALMVCREQGIAITTLSDVYERVTGRVPLEYEGTSVDMMAGLSTTGPSTLLLAGKRLLDIIAGLTGCLPILVVAPFLWVANHLSSRGSIFFAQNRVGKEGKVFRVVKFRSMVPDAEEGTGGAVWARPNDERITPIGRFLRRTRLDELPQFWNVLKGEMSLVGPRPERPEFVELLAEKIPFYRLRHAAKPGITGWAQVRYRYGASVEDSLVKLEYDLYYIKHQSMFLDWQILLETIKVVLGFQGR